MRFALSAAACSALLLLATTPALAVGPAHSYSLDGTLADALGGPSLSLVNGATLGPSGVSFAAGQGLALTSAAFSDSNTYSIGLDFSFSSLQNYNRIINSNGVDAGLYIHNAFDPVVDYYHFGAYDGGAFSVGDIHHLLFTRDDNGISVYLDGSNVLNTAPFSSSVITSSTVLFFVDDQSENAPGFVDSICTYNSKLSASDAAALAGGSCVANGNGGAVPEPASWTMLVGGFGLVGAATRRRRSSVAFS